GPRTIIGGMPPRFEWNIVDLWLPAEMNRSDDPRSPRGLRAFQAHLRPRVTPAEAEAQLNVVAARRAAEYPKDYPPHSRFEVVTVIDWVVREFRGVLYTLFGAVSLLMVIACCNVATLLLARRPTPRNRDRTSPARRPQPQPHRPSTARRERAAGIRRSRCRLSRGLCRHRRAGRIHAPARRSLGNGNQAR